MGTNSLSYMGSWCYEPAADLDQSLAGRLRRFPREPDVTVYALRSFAALVLRGWLRLYHRLEIEGQQNLPLDQSFVMAANHSSHLDTLCLLASLPLQKLHRAFPAAAEDYFFVRSSRLAIATIAVNALPFSRHHQVRRSLDLCGELLSHAGNILILFPEGTRTTGGEIGEFRSGIGKILAGSHVPVVPCFLGGTFQALPKGKWFPRPQPLRLRIGSPRTYATATQDRNSAEQISRDIREAVLALSSKD